MNFMNFTNCMNCMNFKDSFYIHAAERSSTAKENAHSVREPIIKRFVNVPEK